MSDRRVWGGEVGEAGKGHAMQAFLDHGGVESLALSWMGSNWRGLHGE